MSDPVEKKLCDAAEKGRASVVSSLLRDHLEINVNWTDPVTQWTALHIASSNGRAEVVKLLLTSILMLGTDMDKLPFHWVVRRGAWLSLKC